MKTPLALRLDPEVLAAARECARRDNRTLTNFVETALRQRIAEMALAPGARGRVGTDRTTGIIA